MSDKIFTPGSLIIRDLLPKSVQSHYDPSQVLDKKGVSSLVSKLIEYGGDEAHTSLSNLSSLFFNTATDEGYTTPLSDYENDSDERQALIRELSYKVNKLNESSMSPGKKGEKLNELANTYGDKIIKSNLDYMVATGSTAGKMAMTGARGNPSQLSQATATPVMAKDISGKRIPIVIKRSFSEGLSPAEHIAMSYEGRGATVKTQLSTSKPGALFKRITPTVFHEVVTQADCGTKNGINFEVSEKNKPMIIRRYEAGTNKLIDEAEYKRMIMDGVKRVKLRNTMTCESMEGVCQKCYGYDSRGKEVPIGENVGVIAAQSASETLTQAVLATKHKSGVGGKQRNSFEEAQNLLNMPENFMDEATLAKLDGKVTDIQVTALKDSKVFINGIEHFVPRIQQVKVKKGESVQKGQAVSTGTVNPKHLVNLRGLGAGRKYMSDQLRDIYGGGLDNRHFDLLSRNLMKYVTIDDPGETGFLPGQQVEVAKIFPALKKDSYTVKVKDAEGKKLALQILELMPGTILDKGHIDYLKDNDIDEVLVSKSSLSVTPEVKGIQTAKLLDENWVSNLSFNRLKNTIRDAAAQGGSSPIHSTDPITPYVMGSEFGKGKDGKY